MSRDSLKGMIVRVVGPDWEGRERYEGDLVRILEDRPDRDGHLTVTRYRDNTDLTFPVESLDIP